jgi:hypothetical protein
MSQIWDLDSGNGRCVHTLPQRDGVTALLLQDCDADDDTAESQLLLVGCEVC